MYFAVDLVVQRKKNVDTLKGEKEKQKRKKSSQIVECLAKIGFKLVKGTSKFFCFDICCKAGQSIVFSCPRQRGFVMPISIYNVH